MPETQVPASVQANDVVTMMLDPSFGRAGVTTARILGENSESAEMMERNGFVVQAIVVHSDEVGLWVRPDPAYQNNGAYLQCVVLIPWRFFSGVVRFPQPQSEPQREAKKFFGFQTS